MRNKPSSSKIIAASIAGKLHVNKNSPCQDHFQYAQGKNLVAVVSDGAGSARYGKIGAKNLCSRLCDLLRNADFSKIEKEIADAVALVREGLTFHRLNKTKDEKGLVPFAATLVGVVCYQNSGLFFHIGDGAAIALKNKEEFIASRPENGNFSCETFFFTQPCWKENLRFTKFKDAKNILLMSDGLTSFAFVPDFSDIEHKFIDPINSFLSSEPSLSKAKKALVNTLNAPKAQRLNPDDKTLVWIEVA
ncbi:MAG: protein phosphatase 2C domain-containing protein [Alphaproteobacteria bacterium]|nr:protein phosphatase 2C domain-containing protein [Alphaproteobacteria bacterium]